MATYDKLVLVTRRTRLEALIARFNTKGQAKFYIEHSGGDFGDYEQEHDAYHRALDWLRRDLDFGIQRQIMDRSLVPTYTFGGHDVIVTLGQEGLVANVAKYAGEQPIVGVNPDVQRFDGVLLPFLPDEAKHAVFDVLDGRATTRAVTLARIQLDDGQRLLAFNDLFIGTRTHISARYRITGRGGMEAQSSSGVLIGTGRRLDRLDVVGIQHGGRRHRVRRRPERGAGPFYMGGSAADVCGARAVCQPPQSSQVSSIPVRNSCSNR
jgi:NAD kinase